MGGINMESCVNDIPKYFSLGGLDYQVEIKEFVADGKNYGEWNGATCTLSIAQKVGADKVASDRKAQTFYHELVHAILDFISREDLNNDECFVNSFAQALYDFNKTKLY